MMIENSVNASSDNMHFSVIGAGNGGFAIAGYLSSINKTVTLYNRSDEKLKGIKDSKTIYLTGTIAGTGRLSKITTDINTAIEQANIIFIVVTADAHTELASKMLPYLTDNQIIILCPGRTGGILEFRNILKSRKDLRNIILAETNTLMYVCRRNNSSVDIKGLKKEILISSMEYLQTDKLISSILKPIFPQFKKANILETSLQNFGAVMHPAIIINNINSLKKRTDYNFYVDGITHEVADLINRIDEERMMIADKLGINISSILQWLSNSYEYKNKDLYHYIKDNPVYKNLKGPHNINRYILEDIPTGLVPLSYFAKALDIETKNMDMVINKSCTIANIDFWKTGRTLNKMGLDKTNFKDQILRIAQLN
jgi:opine dehydrogenase